MLSPLVCLVSVLSLLLLVSVASVTGSCGVPQPRNNAEPTKLNEAVETYPANSEVTYKCERGFAKERSEDTGISVCVPTSRNDKEYEWSPPEIDCIPLRCHFPLKPANGDIVGTDYTIGKTVTFRCNVGYEMYVENDKVAESPALLCILQIWEGTVPTCEPVQCPDPEPVEHASKVVTRHTYGGRVTYQCLEGFEHIEGNLERTCQSLGRWSGEKPRCKDNKCIDPDVPEFKELHNIKKVEVIVGTEPGDPAKFYCENGQVIESTCSDEGEWLRQDDCKNEDLPGTISSSSNLPLGLIIGVSVGLFMLIVVATIVGVVLHRRGKTQSSSYRGIIANRNSAVSNTVKPSDDVENRHVHVPDKYP